MKNCSFFSFYYHSVSVVMIYIDLARAKSEASINIFII